jgi:hypothetical protein
MNDEQLIWEAYSKRRKIGSAAWGASRGTSTRMAGYAAELMGIPDYKYYTNSLTTHEKKDVKKFMKYINSDFIGSEELLYHGFENKKNKLYKINEIIKISLMAVSGSIYNATSWGDTIFEFPKGTKIVPYDMLSKYEIKELKDDNFPIEFHYEEAITSGEFIIISKRLMTKKEYLGDRVTDIDIPKIEIFTLKQTKTFNPETNTW